MIRLFALLSLCSLVLAGCVFVPKSATDQRAHYDCNLVTKQLTLDMEVMPMGNYHCSQPGCEGFLLGMLVVIPTGSLIISGSIVAVNNTLHWIEQQGSCEESATRIAIEALKQKTKAAGGYLIESGEELLNWLNSYIPDMSQTTIPPAFAKALRPRPVGHSSSAPPVRGPASS